MIVIVEDDNSIQELLGYALKANNYEIKQFNTGDCLIDFLTKNNVEILLLDIMLPGKSGLEILAEIRKNSKLDDLYIIMLTAKSEEYSKVVALDSGADDYITKPFSVLELISRIKAVLRRRKKNKVKENIIKYRDVEINEEERTIKVNNSVVELTYKEYELFIILLENIGRAVSRELIFEKVWGYDFSGSSRTLDVHIRSLRSKIPTIANEIETIRGIGFKLRKDKND